MDRLQCPLPKYPAVYGTGVSRGRPVAFFPALLPARIPWRNRALIAWFGPRGLSSLLLVLLAVFAGVGGAKELVAICSLVVLFSIVVHGFSPVLLKRTSSSVTTGESPTREKGPALPLEDGEYITIEENRALKEAGTPLTVVDARTDRTFDVDDAMPIESVRIDPEHPVSAARALGLPRENVLAILCA